MTSILSNNNDILSLGNDGPILALGDLGDVLNSEELLYTKNDSSIWAQGGINSPANGGGNQAASSSSGSTFNQRIRTTNYLSRNLKIISALEGYEFCIFIYDENNNIIGTLKSDNTIDTSGLNWLNGIILLDKNIISLEKKIRISARTNPQVTITPTNVGDKIYLTYFTNGEGNASGIPLDINDLDNNSIFRYRGSLTYEDDLNELSELGMYYYYRGFNGGSNINGEFLPYNSPPLRWFQNNNNAWSNPIISFRILTTRRSSEVRGIWQIIINNNSLMFRSFIGSSTNGFWGEWKKTLNSDDLEDFIDIINSNKTFIISNPQPTLWEDGTISSSTGTDDNSSNFLTKRLRTNSFLSSSYYSVYPLEGYKIAIYIYNKNEHFLGFWDPDTLTIKSSGNVIFFNQKISFSTFPNSNYKIRIILKKDDETEWVDKIDRNIASRSVIFEYNKNEREIKKLQKEQEQGAENLFWISCNQEKHTGGSNFNYLYNDDLSISLYGTTNSDTGVIWQYRNASSFPKDIEPGDLIKIKLEGTPTNKKVWFDIYFFENNELGNYVIRYKGAGNTIINHYTVYCGQEKIIEIPKEATGFWTRICVSSNTSIDEIVWPILQKETKKTLKVLFLGNSYTEDSTSYVPYIFKSLVSDVNLIIGVSYQSGEPISDYNGWFDGYRKVSLNNYGVRKENSYTLIKKDDLFEVISEEEITEGIEEGINPHNEDWYEKSGSNYNITNDTLINQSKNYYKTINYNPSWSGEKPKYWYEESGNSKIPTSDIQIQANKNYYWRVLTRENDYYTYNDGIYTKVSRPDNVTEDNYVQDSNYDNYYVRQYRYRYDKNVCGNIWTKQGLGSDSSVAVPFGYYKTGIANLTEANQNVDLQYMLDDEDWDIICITSSAGNQGTWQSAYDYIGEGGPINAVIHDYLNKLIDYMKNKYNKSIKLGWLAPQLRWEGDDRTQSSIAKGNHYAPYSSSTSLGGWKQQSEDYFDRYQRVLQEILIKTPIDFIIPCCTAIENARHTSLAILGQGGMTGFYPLLTARDNNANHYLGHLQEGIPCLISAYTTTLKLLELLNIKDKTVLNNNIRPTYQWLEDNGILGRNPSTKSRMIAGMHDLDSPTLMVSEKQEKYNLLLAQKCAMSAAKEPYQLNKSIERPIDLENSEVNQEIYIDGKIKKPSHFIDIKPTTSILFLGDDTIRGNLYSNYNTDLSIPVAIAKETGFICENFGIKDIGWINGYTSTNNKTNIFGYLQRIGNPNYYDDQNNSWSGEKFIGYGDWNDFNTLAIYAGTNDTSYNIGSINDINDNLDYLTVMNWQTSCEYGTTEDQTIIKAIYQAYRYIKESESQYDAAQVIINNSNSTSAQIAEAEEIQSFGKVINGSQLQIIFIDPFLNNETNDWIKQYSYLIELFSEKYGCSHITTLDAPINLINIGDSLFDKNRPTRKTYNALGRYFAKKISGLSNNNFINNVEELSNNINKIDNKIELEADSLFNILYIPSNATLVNEKIYLETGYIGATTGQGGNNPGGIYYRTQTGRSGTNSGSLLKTDNQSILIKLELDWVEWSSWSYSGTTWASATHSNTNNQYISSMNSIYIPKNNNNTNFGISFRKIVAEGEERSSFTSEEIEEIQNNLKFYTITDKNLEISGIPADSKKVGDNFNNINQKFSLIEREGVDFLKEYGNLSDRENTHNGITYQWENGICTVLSGTSTALSRTLIINSSSLLPIGMKSGDRFLLDYSQTGSSIPRIYFIFYNNEGQEIVPNLHFHQTGQYPITIPEGCAGIIIQIRVSNGFTVSQNTIISAKLIKMPKLSMEKPLLVSFIDDDTSGEEYVTKYREACRYNGIFGNYAVLTTYSDENSSLYINGLKEKLLDYEDEGFGMLLHLYTQRNYIKPSNDTYSKYNFKYDPNQTYYIKNGNNYIKVDSPVEQDFSNYYIHPWNSININEQNKNFCRSILLKGIRKMREFGFTNYNYWVTPFGNRGVGMRRLRKEAGLECIISTANDRYNSLQDYNFDYIRRISLDEENNVSYSCLENLKEKIDDLVKNKTGWIIITTHFNEWHDDDYQAISNPTNFLEAINQMRQTINPEYSQTNPHLEGWYEESGNSKIPTSDTQIDSNKTYYYKNIWDSTLNENGFEKGYTRFNDVVQYALAKGLEPVTFSEGWNYYKPILQANAQIISKLNAQE